MKKKKKSFLTKFFLGGKKNFWQGKKKKLKKKLDFDTLIFWNSTCIVLYSSSLHAVKGMSAVDELKKYR